MRGANGSPKKSMRNKLLGAPSPNYLKMNAWPHANRQNPVTGFGAFMGLFVMHLSEAHCRTSLQCECGSNDGFAGFEFVVLSS